ncbi:hypothetical protein EDB92DRAFT_1908256, partial [Lactarius akahatsu]
HGPFKITRILSPVNYQLELPAQWSIHPVFHRVYVRSARGRGDGAGDGGSRRRGVTSALPEIYVPPSVLMTHSILSALQTFCMFCMLCMFRTLSAFGRRRPSHGRTILTRPLVFPSVPHPRAALVTRA